MTEPAPVLSGAKRSRTASRLKHLIPVAVFLTPGVALAWGLTLNPRENLSALTLPETFVVGQDGRVAYRHVGAVTFEVLRMKILPLVAALRRGETGAATSAADWQRISSGERVQ